MAGKQVTPSLGAPSFSCPTCGANSHQTWFSLYTSPYASDSSPWVPDEEFIQSIENDRKLDEKVRQSVSAYFRQRLARAPFLYTVEESKLVDVQLDNCFVSRCYSCRALAIWMFDSLIYPSVTSDVRETLDAPADIRLDFEEAAKIVDASPRGAAALLRLAIQKLAVKLGEKGDNLNEDIASLVRKGLDPQIQQALDIVRVVGNEAVHPGQIDLRDDRATAMQLFDLVNLIVDAMITRPKNIAELYGRLPETKRRAIEQRDGGSGSC
jgi:hypothetical protein